MAVDADPVDNLPAILCHHMEQVIDHFRLRAVMPDLRSNAVFISMATDWIAAQPSAPSQTKKGRKAALLRLRPPTHLLRIRIHHHGGIAMSFEQGELIHHQTAEGMALRLCPFPQQTPVVDILDRMPVQAGELCNVLNRQ